MTTSGESQSKEIQIYLQRPERFWFARLSEMPWFVDPDEADGVQRHPDRDTIRWGAVGAVIQELGAMLARQEFQRHEGEDGAYCELVIGDRFVLSDAERNIVRSWFKNWEAPQGDPWCDSLDNGRHRLSGVWKALPEASLPILSGHLKLEDSIDEMGEDFERGVYIESKIGLLKIADNAPVRDRSLAYFERLAHSAGQISLSPEAEWNITLDLIESGHLNPERIEQEPLEQEVRKPGFFHRLLGRV